MNSAPPKRTGTQPDAATFQRILDGLVWGASRRSDEPIGAAIRRRSPSADPFQAAEEPRRASAVPPHSFAQHYEAGMPRAGARSEVPKPDDASTIGNQLEAIELELVARELRLTGRENTAELRCIRRSFAAHHHPDRVAPGRRAEATRRMAMANMLIDRALSKLEKD